MKQQVSQETRAKLTHSTVKKRRIRGRPYTLYPRQTKHGKKVWYVQFREADGHFGVAKSSGKESKGEAEAWAVEYLKTGQIVLKENITLLSYSKDFFELEKTYAQNKIARGKRFSIRRLNHQSALLHHHILPALGKFRLTDIRYEDIAKLQISKLKEGLSGDTVNGISTVLKAVLTEAYKTRLIQVIPLIERVGVNAKPRGTLSDYEVRQVFSIPWAGFSRPVLNAYALKARTGNLLAASTGMRQGEIVALRRSSVFDSYLEVSVSWDNIFHSLKSTKTGKVRYVPIPSKVKKALVNLMEGSIWKEPDDFVFQGDERDKPMNPEILRDTFYEILNASGIDEQKRIERNLCFHSWRHFFNSLLVNGRINKFKVQTLTGHSTDSMTANYYHPDEYGDVLHIQEETFHSL